MEFKEIKKKIKNSRLNTTKVILDLLKESDFHYEHITNTNAYDSKTGKLSFMKSANITVKGYHDWCPFHQSKSPSHYYINNHSKNTICYSGEKCSAGEGFDIINLVMIFKFGISPETVKLKGIKANGRAFVSSLRYLLSKYPGEIGLDVSVMNVDPKEYFNSLPPEKKQEIKLNRLYQEAAKYMTHILLHTKNGEEALDYLKETRGFKYSVVPVEELIEKYHIGYSLSKEFGDDHLYQHLKRRRGFSDEEILESKLCRKYTDYKTGEEKIRDVLLNSLTLPYIDEDYKMFNYYARNIKPNPGSFEEEVVNEDNNYYQLPDGRTLKGLEYAKEMFEEYVKKENANRHRRLDGSVLKPNGLADIQNSETFFIVEGEISKLSIVAMGHSNAIESRGAKGLKDEHIKHIVDIYKNSEGKLCKTAILCLDPDDTGQSATANTGRRLLEAGIPDVRVVRLPKNMDPNDILKTYKEKAKEYFDALVAGAISYEAFMITHLVKISAKSTPQEKRMIFRNIEKFFRQMPKTEIYFIAQEVADEINIPFNDLRDMWVFEKEKQEQKTNTKNVD